MKSITLALENFSRFAGGAESYAVELSESLVEQGWEVHLVGHSWDGLPKGAIFHQIPKPPRLVPPSLRILFFALAHRTVTRKFPTDIVMGFGNTIEMNVYQSHGGVHFCSSLQKLRAESNPFVRLVKTIFTFVSPKSLARAWIESAPFRMKKRPVIIAISEMIRDDISRKYSLPKSVIKLVYNGVNLEKFSKQRDLESRAELRRNLDFADNRVLFLFVAYDFRKKGVKYLIEAAAKVRDKLGTGTFGVVVVGSTPSSTLSSMVRNMGLDQIVRFKGPTKHPEVYYNACDVFVLPTFYDACSLVIFEAMAAGLPAITTRQNGASGVINHGLDGMVIQDPLNTNELASAMERFLDPSFLENASNRARRTAANYSIQSNHRQIISLLETSLGSRQSP